MTRRNIALFTLSTLCVPALALAAGAQTPQAMHSHNSIAHAHQPGRAQQAPLTPEEQAAQIVDRFSFGATPGLIDAVAAQGWQQWFNQQLQPDAIPDAALDKRLQNYPSLGLSPAQLSISFPDGVGIRRVADGKEAMPDDPQLKGVYEVLLARYQARQEKDRADAGVVGNAGGPVTPQTQAQQAQLLQQQKDADQARAATLAAPILAQPAANRLNAVLALPVPDRVVLTAGLQEPMKAALLQGMSPHDRELMAEMGSGYGGNVVADNELSQAKILRAVLSQRQLQEVMTDFWLNHFNIDVSKNGDEANYANEFERDAIRPHALGRFKDLLLATAESPAMMIYLDNWTSIGPNSQAAMRGNNLKNKRGGLNENYGREVMELHTLGVDGGYTQADVTALSNILTGWTVDRPQFGGPFEFVPQRHEPGNKQWLGHTVQAGGQQEGIDALTYLAEQPATAKHICFELAQRFVNDTPPPALVDRMVAAWTASDGDIAQVLQAMVQSPEFFDRTNFHNKVKSPLEFVASAMRATNTDPTNPQALVAQLRAMGEPLYRCQPPTGYPVTGSGWMNSSALIDRLNFALALSQGHLGGMHLDAPLLLASALLQQPTKSPTQPNGFRAHAVALNSTPASDPDGEDQALALLERALVAGEVTPATNQVIRGQLAQRDQQADTAAPSNALDAMVAMILGSPEFQVH